MSRFSWISELYAAAVNIDLMSSNIEFRVEYFEMLLVFKIEHSHHGFLSSSPSISRSDYKTSL